MRYDPFEADFFVRNRANLMALLEPGSLAIIHSNDVMPTSGDGVMGFCQNSDLFYLTGIDQEESVLMLFPEAKHAEHRELLFVRETSDLIRVWEGDKLTVEQAQARSGVANVAWTEQFEPTLRRLARQANKIYLNANEHPRRHSAVESRQGRFRKRYQSLYPDHGYRRLAPLLHGLREIKAEAELARIQRACDITGQGFRRVLGFVRPGIREYEIETEFLHEFTRHGSQGFAYQPIVASGPNACVLHYVDNDAMTRDGDMVLLDVAAEYANYKADLTRTIPANGKFSTRQRQVYEAVLRVMRACSNELLRPGTDIEDYAKSTAKLVERELIELGLLDAAEVAAERAKDNTGDEVQENGRLYRKYFMHGVSHSLGLDVHDVRTRHRQIKPGMVVTVEPGIYIPQEGLGIRLENVVCVGQESNTDLMATIPIEADEIEDLMG